MGDKILVNVGKYLKQDIPTLKRFSRRNLYPRRALYFTCREQGEFIPELVEQIPWGHSATLIEKIKDPIEHN